MLKASLQELLPALKGSYGSIYFLDISAFAIEEGLNSHVLIRAMSRVEFNSFTDAFTSNPVEAVRKLIATHTYGAELIDEFKAGIDEFICSAVSLVSGFASEEALAQGVEEGRTYAQSLEAAITMYICKAFNSYKPSDVDNMTLEEQMKLVAMAEQMTGRELPYEDYLDDKPKHAKAKPVQPVRPPINEEYRHSHGGHQPVQQMPEQDDHTVVTAANLHEQIARSQEIFSGRP